jgi:hypothetical protein
MTHPMGKLCCASRSVGICAFLRLVRPVRLLMLACGPAVNRRLWHRRVAWRADRYGNVVVVGGVARRSGASRAFGNAHGNHHFLSVYLPRALGPDLGCIAVKLTNCQFCDIFCDKMLYLSPRASGRGTALETGVHYLWCSLCDVVPSVTVDPVPSVGHPHLASSNTQPRLNVPRTW